MSHLFGAGALQGAALAPAEDVVKDVLAIFKTLNDFLGIGFFACGENDEFKVFFEPH